MARDPFHALSFGAAAAHYDRGRPSYPDEAVEWILAQTAAAAGSASGEPHPAASGAGDPGVLRVVDLGAGTGKFTASLVGRVATVTAVEPDALMRERLTANLPGVVAVDGSGERIPLPDSSVDLVTIAQAWHWVDAAEASREIARVLAPGGTLALVWNIRDESVDWVARMGEIMGASTAERYDSRSPELGDPLRPTAYAEFGWTSTMTHDQMLALVTSRSYVIVMPDDERRAMLARLDELWRTDSALVGRDSYELPYSTRVTLARVAAA